MRARSVVAGAVRGVRGVPVLFVRIVVVIIVRKQETMCSKLVLPLLPPLFRRRAGLWSGKRAERGSQRLGGARIIYASRGYHGRRRTGPGGVRFFNCRRRRRQTSQCVRAVAMSRTSLLLLLWSFCATAAVSVTPPPSFRSANVTAAALLASATAGGKYVKTVVSGDEMAVSVREYADCAVFRVQARTRGYVALAFADHVIPTRPVDVLLAWVDDETGTGHLLVSVARKRLGPGIASR